MESDTDYWREFGRRLGIEVVAPAEVQLAGATARFSALLPQFGGPAGMIVDADWEVIEPHKSALLSAGYGFSCVGAGNLRDLQNPEILASAREMLADWGWSSSAPEPDWLTE